MGARIKQRLKRTTKPFEPPPKPSSSSSPKSAANDIRAEQWPGPTAAARRNAPQVAHRRQDRASGDDDDPAADVLLRAVQVRKRYGDCSDMWLSRRLHDDSGFPKPVYIAGLRHWRLSDLVRWENAQAELPAPQPRILEQRDKALEALEEKRAEQKRKKAEQAETAQP